MLCELFEPLKTSASFARTRTYAGDRVVTPKSVSHSIPVSRFLSVLRHSQIVFKMSQRCCVCGKPILATIHECDEERTPYVHPELRSPLSNLLIQHRSLVSAVSGAESLRRARQQLRLSLRGSMYAPPQTLFQLRQLTFMIATPL
jgi:hypothetical protein